MVQFLATILLALSGSPTAEAAICSPTSRPGDRCQLAIDRIRPTQFGLGFVDVEAKQKDLAGSGKKARKVLRANRAQIVVGPGGTYYLIDRHHLTRAAHSLSIRNTHAEIVDNLSGLSEEEFWKTMQERSWVHLSDENGVRKSVSQLPRHIRDLKDDPYRSLAWVVRQSGGFEKTPIPFAEFQWADYFRERIVIAPGRAGWEKAVKDAIALATVEGTNHLPGAQIISAKEQPEFAADCWKQFKKLGLPRHR